MPFKRLLPRVEIVEVERAGGLEALTGTTFRAVLAGGGTRDDAKQNPTLTTIGGNASSHLLTAEE